MTLLTERRLKVKAGTQRTFLRIRVSVSCKVPIWLTGTSIPFANFTTYEIAVGGDENKEGEQII